MELNIVFAVLHQTVGKISMRATVKRLEKQDLQFCHCPLSVTGILKDSITKYNAPRRQNGQ